jgi:hypothetical protein
MQSKCIDLPLRTDGDICTKGGTQKLPKTFKIVKTYFDMTIHWKSIALSDDTGVLHTS